MSRPGILRATATLFFLMTGLLSRGEAPIHPGRVDADLHTVLLYHFDTPGGIDVRDHSRNAMHGTLQAEPNAPDWDDGVVGSGLYFDGLYRDEDGDGKGDADGVMVPDDGRLAARPQITVEFWFKPERLGPTQYLLSRGNRYGLRLVGHDIEWRMIFHETDPPSQHVATSSGPIKENEWQHVAATYDGRAMHIYIDGKEFAKKKVGLTPIQGRAITLIGRDRDDRPAADHIRGFRGWIDELRISSVARTEFPHLRGKAGKPEVKGTEAQGNPSSKAPPGWKLAFADDFERTLPGSDWEPLTGNWSIENGKLIGTGQMLCAWRFPGPQRLEYDGRSRDVSPVGDHQVCDLSGMLAVGRGGISTGYFFGFGSNGNTRSKILVEDGEVASYDKQIKLFKTHHVVCEFDGERLRHEIDGETVYNEIVESRLTGPGHEQVGVYLWLPGYIDNVRVYTRTGQGLPPRKRSVKLSPPADAGLIKNGSFEQVIQGVRPRVPTDWTAEGWTMDDRVELVTDVGATHRGQRFLRLYAPGKYGLRMHSVSRDPRKLVPGAAYAIRLWARQAGEAAATLRIQPGDYESQLGDQWQLHEAHYAHPGDADPEMGMFFSITGGAADVDDVSMVLEGEAEPVPAELRSDWKAVDKMPGNHAWLKTADGPSYRERIPVVVRETAGVPVKQHAIALSLRSLFRVHNFDFVSSEKIQITDSTAPGSASVPWGLVARFPTRRVNPDRAVGHDLLVFLADCPPLSEKTYYVYLTDRSPGKPVTISDQVPDAMNIPSDYPHRLAVDVGGVERNIGKTKTRPTGQGNVLWWAHNTRRVFPDDAPRTEQSRVRIAAARREWESFQVVVGSDAGLTGVRLRASNLTHRDGRAAIDAGRITIERQYHSFLFANAELRSGLTPAPLLPWRRENVPAGKQVAAWVTVRVPDGIPAGLYSGTIIADSGDGWQGKLPVELEVFDFSLPRVFTFTPLLGFNLGRSDVRENMPAGWEATLRGKKYFSYAAANAFSTPTSHRQTFLDLYRYFGERHITPTVYGLFSGFGKDGTGATYYASRNSIEIDLAGIDAIIDQIEEEQLDVKYLIHLGAERVRGKDPEHPGYVTVYLGDDPGKRTYGYHGTPQGRQFFRLWLTALRDHLRPKGWSNRTVIYTDDEDVPLKTNYGTVDELVTAFNNLIHEVAPEFRSLAADNASGRWYTAFEGTDFFTGAMIAKNRERFEELGNTWWGIYNRKLTLSSALGNSRIVALHCWLYGWKYSWQYHTTHWNQAFWFNPSLLHYYPANAGYPDRFFVRTDGGNPGFYMIYPWPARRGPKRKPEDYGFGGSTHVEAIRESAEDYEYLVMLEALRDKTEPGSQQSEECQRLLDTVRAFVKSCEQGDGGSYSGTRATFIVDGDKLQALRREMGRMIAEFQADR